MPRDSAAAEVVLDYGSGWREPAAGGRAPLPRRERRDELIDFTGYAYTREVSPISGRTGDRLRPARPQIWRVPFRDQVSPSLVVKAPLGGYVVPAAWAADIGARLALHGIQCEPVRTASERVRVEAFRATRVQFARRALRGPHARAARRRAGSAKPRTSAPARCSCRSRSRAARLVMHLLEPQAPDSFAAWGFFNACFEQKEYLEPYVAEQIARTMLAADIRRCRSEFDRRLEEDAGLRREPPRPAGILPAAASSWDSHLNLYPRVPRGRTAGLLGCHAGIGSCIF